MELGLTLQRAMTGHGSGRLDTLADKPPLLVTCGAPQIRVGKTDFPDGEPARAGGGLARGQTPPARAVSPTDESAVKEI